jgi:hypothetical protein
VVLIIYQFRARRPLLTIRTMLTVVPLKAAIYEQRKTDALRAGPPELLMGVLHDVACASMGLGAGGEIRQSIETPVESPENWELQTNASAWVHIANSRAWQQITGERPPILAPSTADYSAPGLPWFDWYDDTFARSDWVTHAKKSPDPRHRECPVAARVDSKQIDRSPCAVVRPLASRGKSWLR